MNSMYLIVFTLLGGLLSVFGVAGWSSFNTKTLPDISILFRWFIGGLLTCGLGSYAWLYGAGGDPGKLMESVGDALEVKEVMETLKTAVATSPALDAVKEAAETAAATAAAVTTAATTIKVGMPNF